MLLEPKHNPLEIGKTQLLFKEYVRGHGFSNARSVLIVDDAERSPKPKRTR